MSWINDPVNSPKHYTDSHPGMECIDLTADTTFCLGNCCKYLWRYHSKGRPLEDLEKARWYLCRVIDYGEKIAWTRQQYDILTALVANPVIELIRRLRKATHRPEPANDPTICAICGAPLTDSASSICPDCRELEKDW